MSYTADQLTREAQLLVTELALLADFVIGEGAGLRALGLKPTAAFAQSRHPDDLHKIHELDVFEHIERIERYVRDQQWSQEVPSDVSALRVAVERTFSPAVVNAYEQEREESGEINVPAPFDAGATDIPLGYFHRGILANLVAKATARLKVDQNERLTMADIAMLIDVREPTIVTNAHRKNFPTVEDGNRRYAEPFEALPWMQKQGYISTRMPASDSDVVREPEPKNSEMVFVPVARDGSWFGPDCRSGGRFTIGAKGSEVKYTDYFAALDALLKMPTPHWRRPNAHGIHGIVTGVHFDRMRRTDLEHALSRTFTAHGRLPT